MAESQLPFAHLYDARLASHATAATPAWLWQPDGRRILWANAAAAALHGAPSPVALTRQAFDPAAATAARIAQLAEMLPANGSPRLSVLEVQADGAEHRPMCLCSRLLLDDGTSAILAVAAAAIGRALPLADRVRQLLTDIDAPLAAFAPDGVLIHATPAAGERIGEVTTLASMAASQLGSEAIAKGHADGMTPHGLLHLDRIGRGSDLVLLVTLPAAPAQSAEPAAIVPATPDDVAKPAEAESAPCQSSAPSPTPQPPDVAPNRATERAHPLRFVWQMDRDGRFTIASDAFVSLIGADNAAVLGQPWIDVARKLGLDPDEQISHAIDSRETWSGIAISWPVGGSDERLTVDMSGLPMFDRERAFLGYRGFGVCRDAERFVATLEETVTPSVDATAAVEFPTAPQEAKPQETTASEAAPEIETDVPTLSAGERNAFRELARQLNARLKGDHAEGTGGVSAAQDRHTQATGAEPESPATVTDVVALSSPPTRDGVNELMDRLPVGVLVYRHDMPIYANRAFLKWSGDASLESFIASGGIDRLFLESDVTGGQDGAGKKLTLTTGDGTGLAECRLFSIMWDGERAHALAIVPAQSALRAEDADLHEERRRTGELRSIIDISADGVVIIDGEGAIVRLNRGAESLFGRETEAVEGHAFVELLAPEHREAVSADFAMLVETDVQRPGREVASGVQDPGKVLFMTVGRISADKPTYCAVFRDITQWKRAEQDLIAAKRQAEQASRQKSDFLTKISHEIRTPLNAIIGFSEVMMEERLGRVENERYRAYLKDIHASGAHVVSLLNDLLDLSKIEAGKLELNFADVDLNELTQHCVALMQPQANNARVIIRTSLAPTLPQIVADARSVRQILLNLLSNSIKFTAAGGQVIVSTALTEGNEAVLRVRDTGIGMSEKEIELALEPFRQIETSARGGSGGTGLGLPLTKALAEANRANFAIKSNINSGTLVEVAFPTTQTPHR